MLFQFCSFTLARSGQRYLIYDNYVYGVLFMVFLLHQTGYV